jgi:hypothetical protein
VVTAKPCTRVAVVGGYVYPCRLDADGQHHFAMHWPSCNAPFCLLPPGHSSLHDIPSGRAEFMDATAAPPVCAALQLGYPPCKHPPKYRAVSHGRAEADLCGRHAHWLRDRPAWQIRPLEAADA